MAGLHFDITADNSNFKRKLEETERGVRETSKRISESGEGMDSLFRRLATSLAAIGAGFSAQQLIREIVQVRGEFQKLEVAFDTMLGKEKSNALMQQMVEFSAKTPFDLKGVADGARQLIAYGEASENVIDDLTRLGNLAAGLSQPLNDLVYLYGTTMTQGRLYTQDYNQFVGRGIPMGRELAKVFGVAESEVRSLVEAGKIGFPEVQKVIQNLTNEGGMFYNLMQEQSKTIPGQLSNLGDSWDTMMNEIGKSTQGVMSDAIGYAQTLVENYDKVLDVLKYVVAVYGSYKAALFIVGAAQKVQNTLLDETRLQMSLAAMQGIKLSEAQAMAAARTTLLSGAFNKLKAVFAANPIGLIVTLITTLGVALFDSYKEAQKFNSSMVDLKEVTADYQATVAQEKSEIDRLFGTLEGARKGTTQYEEAKSKIISQYKPYLQGLINEQGELTNLEAAYYRVTAAVEASAKARAMESANTEAAKNYGERNQDLYEHIEEVLSSRAYNYSDRQIQAIITRLSQSISETGKAPEELIKRLENPQYGRKGSPVIKDIRELERQYLIYNDDLNRIEQAFGTQSVGQEAFSAMTDNQLKANIEALKSAQSKLTDATNSVYVELYNYGKKVGVTISSLDELYLSLGNYEKELKRRNAEKSTGASDDIQSDISKEVESATKRIKVLKQEIADLRSGKLQVEAGKTVESAIEAKTKELQSVQKTLETLTGKKSSKSSLPTSDGTDDTVSERLKAEEDLNRMLLDLQKRNQSDEIALMKDGRKKRLAEINADYEARKAEIAAKAAELAELNRKAGITDVDSNGLTISQGVGIAKANLLNQRNRTVSEADLLVEERRAMDEYLKEYGSFMEKREAITRQYNERITNATTEGERLSLGREKQDALKELDFSEFKKSIDFTDVFGNLGELTSGALSDLKDKLSEYINKAASKLRPEDLKELQDAFAKIEFEEIDRNPFASLASSMDDYRTAQDAVEKAQQELDTVLKGGMVITGQYMDENQKLHNILLTQEQAEKNLAKAQSDRQKSLEKVNATINNIGQKGSAVVNSGQQIVGMLENFGVEVPEVVSTTLDGIGQIMQGLASIDITKPFSLITGSISVITGIGNTIAGWFGAGDSKHEKQIQRLQDQIDALDKSYDRLGKSIEKAYSTDASELIEQQNKMLEQQKVLIQQQMAEEEAKKHTDEEKMQEYSDRLEEIEELQEDNKDKAIEAIAGTDVMSAIDDFAQAYADAWANGTDAATASTKAVKSLIQGALLEFLKKQLSPTVEKFVTKLSEYMADGVLSPWEKAQLDQFKKEMDDIAANYYDQTADYWKEDSAGQQSASSRAFGTEITQEQGAEISGRLTAVAESNIRIEESIVNAFALMSSLSVKADSRNTLLAEIKNLMIASNGYLEDLVNRTKKIHEEFLQRLVNIDNNTKMLA